MGNGDTARSQPGVEWRRRPNVVGRARLALARTPWANIYGYSITLLLYTTLMAWSAEPGSWRALCKSAVGWAVVTVIVARVAANGYGGLQRYRAASLAESPLQARLAALIPLALLAWSRLDRANLAACKAWLLRRPLPAQPPGTSFGLLSKSSYGTFVLIALFAILIELPLDTVIVSVMTNDAVLAGRLRIVLAVLAVYSLLWIAGDRYLMRGSAIVLDEAALNIRVGTRLAARIPLAAINACTALPEGAPAWRRQHGVVEGQWLTATPADAANVVVEVIPRAGLTLWHWQVERPAPRCLFLFVDAPEALCAAIAAVSQPKLSNRSESMLP